MSGIEYRFQIKIVETHNAAKQEKEAFSKVCFKERKVVTNEGKSQLTKQNLEAEKNKIEAENNKFKTVQLAVKS